MHNEFMNRTAHADAAAAPALRIGELADAIGLAPDTLRYYERLGLLPTPQRSVGGFRLFGHEAIERLRFVKQAQALGLALEEIRQLVDASCGEVEPLLRARLAELDAHLAELRGLRRTLSRALSKPKFLTHRQDNSFIFNHHSRISGCVAWEHPDELEGSLLQRGRLGQSLDARRVRFRGQSALVAGPGPQVRHQRLQALQR